MNLPMGLWEEKLEISCLQLCVSCTVYLEGKRKVVGTLSELVLNIERQFQVGKIFYKSASSGLCLIWKRRVLHFYTYFHSWDLKAFGSRTRHSMFDTSKKSYSLSTVFSPQDHWCFSHFWWLILSYHVTGPFRKYQKKKLNSLFCRQML